MGRIIEKVEISNVFDIEKSKKGIINSEQIRKVEVEAIVDTGATYMCLPPKIIKELDLMEADEVSVKTGNGITNLKLFDGAFIYIKERTTTMRVMENKDDSIPPLIGYLVLEAMDWVINPNTKELTGNPENEGKWIIDMY